MSDLPENKSVGLYSSWCSRQLPDLLYKEGMSCPTLQGENECGCGRRHTCAYPHAAKADLKRSFTNVAKVPPCQFRRVKTTERACLFF